MDLYCYGRMSGVRGVSVAWAMTMQGCTRLARRGEKADYPTRSAAVLLGCGDAKPMNGVN